MSINGDAIQHGDLSIPSLYEHIRAWAKKVVSKENRAEALIVASTLFILGVLFFSFGHALQNFTVTGGAPF